MADDRPEEAPSKPGLLGAALGAGAGRERAAELLQGDGAAGWSGQVQRSARACNDRAEGPAGKLKHNGARQRAFSGSDFVLGR